MKPLSADNEKYLDDGRYWQGGIWAPANFMVFEEIFGINCSLKCFGIRNQKYESDKQSTEQQKGLSQKPVTAPKYFSAFPKVLSNFNFYAAQQCESY
jgi:hypothetical protein